MASTLEVVLLYLVAAVGGVVVCRTFKLPPMLGYLAVGIVIGPNALALAADSASVAYLAEFGVVFLMFVIGLEFNLPKLRSMRKLVFGLGFAQVALTLGGTVAGHFLLVWAFDRFGDRPWELSWQGAVVLGAAISMSSTAIVVKMMADRLELESEHGKRVLGTLLFQDLAVVPFLVMIPALDSTGADLAASLGWALLKAAALLALLLAGGQKLMRWWLTLVARRKSEELFVLNLLLVTLGLAYLTEHAGLSLALGAFVAGMLVAETEYKHQVETDIRPFHDVLLGLFFITIGMKLDWRPVWDQWALVLLLTLLPVLAKFALVAALARLFGAMPGVALRTGLYLAQAGEFGFVLLTLGTDNGLVAPQWISPVLASMVLSMLATPLLILYSNRIVNKLSASDWLMQSVAMTSIAKRSINTSAHVIICGYGRSGQNLARILDGERIPYMALDLDPDRVRQAAAAGQSVVFGDAARLQSLMAAGLARASAVVVSYHDTASALKILKLVQSHAPKVPVIVRTIDDADLERLQAAGATEVVPEAVEGSLMLASHALALVGVPMRRVIRVVQDQRDARYSLLRGWFHGADDDTVDELQQARLHSVTLPPAPQCDGQTLADQALHAVGVNVVSVRRANGKVTVPSDDLVLSGGDTLVLSGLPEPLALAEGKLLGRGVTMLRRRDCLCLAGLWPWGAGATETVVPLLRRGAVAVLMRHARTEPGIGDPPGFRLASCATQRNLSEAGREQARQTGQWFSSRRLVPARVRSSAWCRCLDTARLGFGQAEAWPALNSFFDDRESEPRQSAELRAALRQLPRGRFEVWVTHQVNISALVGEGSAMGEAVVVEAGADAPRVLGRIAPA